MQFSFDSFNGNRESRGADAARVLVTQDDGDKDLLWMSKKDITDNVMEFGPFKGLLDAAHAYRMDINKLLSDWINDPVATSKFLRHTDPERNRDGYWRHVDWPTEESDSEMNEWLERIGFEVETVWLEHDDRDEANDVRTRYFDGGDPDFLAWEPVPPAKDAGWIIVSIHDHEEGPVAIYVRNKNAEARPTNAPSES